MLHRQFSSYRLDVDEDEKWLLSCEHVSGDYVDERTPREMDLRTSRVVSGKVLANALCIQELRELKWIDDIREELWLSLRPC